MEGARAGRGGREAETGGRGPAGVSHAGRVAGAVRTLSPALLSHRARGGLRAQRHRHRGELAPSPGRVGGQGEGCVEGGAPQSSNVEMKETQETHALSLPPGHPVSGAQPGRSSYLGPGPVQHSPPPSSAREHFFCAQRRARSHCVHVSLPPTLCPGSSSGTKAGLLPLPHLRWEGREGRGPLDSQRVGDGSGQLGGGWVPHPHQADSLWG